MAICDDDCFFCSELKRMMGQWEKQEEIKIDIDIFSEGGSLLEHLGQGKRYHLIFLNIMNGKMDGISVGRSVRELLQDEKCAIVYISRKKESIADLDSVRPLDLLVKPATEKKLNKIMQLYSRIIEADQGMFCYQIRGNASYISLHHILYFRVENRRITIHTEKSQDIVFYGKMSEIEKTLDTHRFIRISRSELVNYNAVQHFQQEEVLLRNGETLPIVPSRRKIIEGQIKRYLREGM